MFRKMISLVTVFILIVCMSGCNGGAGNSDGTSPGKEPAAQGPIPDSTDETALYGEAEIGSNSGVTFLKNGRFNSKNQLMVLDYGDGKNPRFVNLDKEGKPVGEITPAPAGGIGIFDLDSEDNIYLLLRERISDTQTGQKITVINPAGEILNTIDLGKYNIDAGIGKSPVVMDMALDNIGNIYLATLSGIKVLDKNGRETKKIGSDAYYSIDLDSEGNIVAICIAKQTVDKISPSSGKNIWSADIKDFSSGAGSNFSVSALKVRFDSSDNSYCLMNDGGIRRYAADGKLIETVLDFSQYFILASGNTVCDLSIDSKGNFYVVTTKDEKFELFRYEIEAGKQKVRNRTEISVAVPISEKWLEMAALRFEKANPDYNIKIKPYEQEYNYSGNYENYVKSLNTELLTGKGPDIFLASGLSTGRYIEKNLLAELDGYMAKEGSFDDSHYLTNIFDALKYNNKLYTLPVSISFNILAVDKKMLEKESAAIDDSNWNWKDAVEIGRKLTESGGNSRRLFMPVSRSMLLGYLLQGNYSQFLDINNRKASFNSREFIDLLEMVKTFGESDQSETNSYSPNYSDVDAIEKGSIVFNPQVFSDYTSYAFLRAVYNDRVKLLKYPVTGNDKGGVFNSQALFALNNNSSNKDIAWKFLKLLLSDETQSEELGGFAVNRNALKKVAERAMDMTGSGGMTYAISTKDSDKPKIFKPKPLTQEDIDYVNSFIENMRIHNSANMQVQKIVSEEAAAYFSGSKSPEDTAKLIQDKVELYLGE